MEKEEEDFLKGCKSGDLKSVICSYNDNIPVGHFYLGLTLACLQDFLPIIKFLVECPKMVCLTLDFLYVTLHSKTIEPFVCVFEKIKQYQRPDVVKRESSCLHRLILDLNNDFDTRYGNLDIIRYLCDHGHVDRNEVFQQFYRFLPQYVKYPPIIKWMFDFFNSQNNWEYPIPCRRSHFRSEPTLCDLLNHGVSWKIFKKFPMFTMTCQHRVLAQHNERLHVVGSVLADILKSTLYDVNIFYFCIQPYICFEPLPIRKSKRQKNFLKQHL